jgi:hypothetical protein
VQVPTLVDLRQRLALRGRIQRALSSPPPAARARSLRTSVTDHVDYTSFCALAAANAAAFASFKREPVYREVLEHVTCAQGAAYLERVLEQSPELVPLFDRFRENDRLGSPHTCAYGEHGRFSPTTLRYVKVLSDLLLLFGPLDGLRIVEVGGGYGGQCFVIRSAAEPASYTLVDLDESRALQETYLARLGVHGVRFLPPGERDGGGSDLVISNYAFSELRRDVQERYLEQVLRPSARGYVTCNWVSPPDFRPYSRAELLAAIPGSRFLHEVPLTAADNAVLVWGDHAQA